MKRAKNRTSLILIFSIALVTNIKAQTNTFPANGNVGIGTATPNSKLHVAGDGAVIKLQNTSYEDTENEYYGWLGGYDKSGDEVWWLGEGGGNSKYLGFFMNRPGYDLNFWNNNKGITIKNSGAIGIGTTSPSASLEIQNPATNFVALKVGPEGDSHSYFYIDRYNGKDGGIIMTENGINDYQLANLDNRDFGIYSYSKSDYVFHIQNTTGNVGIGTATPGIYKLAVNGNVRAKEVKVETANWPDYVFKEDYSLPTLEEVENHIKEKGHLPNMPSAREVEANGIELGEMNRLLLEKVEEMMLYIIQQEKRIGILEKNR